ncbi:hypothetical protein LRB11_17240, partial [Ectothiorhodospira haloalkaliphila]|nr:hypothetical protein [Ectothiorhodospira haloalkaliphila]
HITGCDFFITKTINPSRQIRPYIWLTAYQNPETLDMLEMDGEALRGIIESAVSDKEKLARDAAKFVKPAKRDREATITFDNHEELRIQSPTVQAMPIDHGRLEPERSIEDYPDVEVIIRATDLDSYKRGWGAVVPVLGERRVRLQVDPSVDPAALMANPRVRANITVVSETDASGKPIPRVVFLRELTGKQS